MLELLGRIGAGREMFKRKKWDAGLFQKDVERIVTNAALYRPMIEADAHLHLHFDRPEVHRILACHGPPLTKVGLSRKIDVKPKVSTQWSFLRLLRYPPIHTRTCTDFALHFFS